MQNHLTLKARTFWRLGPRNVWNVAWYRLRLRLGIHPVQRVRRELGGTHCFAMPQGRPATPPPPSHWCDHALHFGWHQEPLGTNPPDWHRNPFTGARVQGAELPWWKLSDFGSGAGDIKAVWEASRFDWVLAFAQQARCGDADALGRLNTWLADWVRHNPAYNGPNWKCGQEASIRVLHLLLAARLLAQLEKPQPDLVQIVEAHLARIVPTLAYAMAQDNNHGTSEAAALFMGGDWLARQAANSWRSPELRGSQSANTVTAETLAVDARQARAWAQAGRRWLENRATRLIEPDGGFSQHSVNYHRLMLDTLSLAELWRQWYQLPAFTSRFHQRARAAATWLMAMVDGKTGDAPNLGANDGANLLPLTDADYRDYRPCIELAHALFFRTRAFPDDGFHRSHLNWLGLSTDEAVSSEIGNDRPAGARTNSPSGSVRVQTFHARGYMMLSMGPWRVLFRYPDYRFRPGHCDALHVDLWYDGQNLLRDAGSYSYNAEASLAAYFSGPAGHNVIEFDGRDHMPRLSRFLRGAWLKTETLEGPLEHQGQISAAAAFRDWRGACHRREIALTQQGLRVVDDVSHMKERAVLRWRLAPGDWQIEDGTAYRDGHLLRIQSSIPLSALRIVTGMESRYYLRKNPLPVLEAEVSSSGQIISEYSITR